MVRSELGRRRDGPQQHTDANKKACLSKMSRIGFFYLALQLLPETSPIKSSDHSETMVVFWRTSHLRSLNRSVSV